MCYTHKHTYCALVIQLTVELYRECVIVLFFLVSHAEKRKVKKKKKKRKKNCEEWAQITSKFKAHGHKANQTIDILNRHHHQMKKRKERKKKNAHKTWQQSNFCRKIYPSNKI